MKNKPTLKVTKKVPTMRQALRRKEQIEKRIEKLHGKLLETLSPKS